MYFRYFVNISTWKWAGPFIFLSLKFQFKKKCSTPEPLDLGTKDPLLMRIQFCSNEGPRPFPRGDSYEIVKTH